MLGSRTSGQSETERSPDFRRFGPAKKPSKPWGCGSSGVRANAYLQRRLNAAFNARDPDALIAVCDPTIEVHSVFTAVGGATYQGHEGARRWLGEIVEAWTEFHVVVEATFDLGEQTLAFVVLHGRGSVSGAEVVMPYAQVMRWREGRCVWFKAYAHREDALSDLEVSEDTLEPILPVNVRTD